MPYIVTTKRQDRVEQAEAVGIGYEGESRRAVATLDEARYLIEDALDHDNVVHPPAIAEGWRQLGGFSESGGAVGPLPDGTVIEVEAVCWNWIIGCAEDLGIDTETIHADAATGKGDLAIMDAYNAAQKG